MKMIAVKVYFNDGGSEFGFIRECDIDELYFDVFFPFPNKVTRGITQTQGAMAVNAYLQDVGFDQCEFLD